MTALNPDIWLRTKDLEIDKFCSLGYQKGLPL